MMFALSTKLGVLLMMTDAMYRSVLGTSHSPRFNKIETISASENSNSEEWGNWGKEKKCRAFGLAYFKSEFIEWGFENFTTAELGATGGVSGPLYDPKDLYTPLGIFQEKVTKMNNGTNGIIGENVDSLDFYPHDYDGGAAHSYPGDITWQNSGGPKENAPEQNAITGGTGPFECATGFTTFDIRENRDIAFVNYFICVGCK